VRVGDNQHGSHAAARVEQDFGATLHRHPDVEDWTQNGPYLDGISFVTGLKDGKALVYQRSQDDRQVPKFRSNMTPPEIAAILESLFRVRGGAVEYKMTALARVPSSGSTVSNMIMSISTATRCGARAGGRRGGRRQALPDPVRCRAVALLQCAAARLRSDRSVRPAGLGGDRIGSGGCSGSPGKGGTWPGSSAGGGPPGRGGLLAIC
jgi:hypothetical protein